MKYRILISGMECEGCVKTVKKTIESFGGRNVTVSLEEKLAEFDIENVDIKEIEDAIIKKGYEVKEVEKL